MSDQDEGSKVRNYYHVQQLPAILLLDPVTGARMASWQGFVEPDRYAS